MQNAAHQYGQGAANSHQSPPFADLAQLAQGNSVSSLRQFRKKDGAPEKGDLNHADNSHIARVPPHNHYPAAGPNDFYQYHQYTDQYNRYKEPTAQVKYSEIAETPVLHHVDHLKHKEPPKEYMEMCNIPPIKQQYQQNYHQMAQKEQASYKPESQYHPQQYPPSKYPQCRKYPGGGAPAPMENDFLAKLQRIHPTLARSIMSEQHIRESQTTYPLYPQTNHQRYYPLQNPYNYPPYNYPSCNYSHRNAQMGVAPPPARYPANERAASPRRQYPENLLTYQNAQKYAPAQYNQEYPQQYQRRQEYYQQQCRTNFMGEMTNETPENLGTSGIRQYFESWAEEEGTTEMRLQNGETPNEQPVIVIESNEIPNIENVSIVPTENGQFIINSTNLETPPEKTVNLHIVEKVPEPESTNLPEEKSPSSPIKDMPLIEEEPPELDDDSVTNPKRTQRIFSVDDIIGTNPIKDDEVPTLEENSSQGEEEGVQYTNALSIEGDSVILEIGGALVQLHINHVNETKVLSVVGLSENLVIDTNGNYQESLEGGKVGTTEGEIEKIDEKIEVSVEESEVMGSKDEGLEKIESEVDLEEVEISSDPIDNEIDIKFERLIREGEKDSVMNSKEEEKEDDTIMILSQPISEDILPQEEIIEELEKIVEECGNFDDIISEVEEIILEAPKSPEEKEKKKVQRKKKKSFEEEEPLKKTKKIDNNEVPKKFIVEEEILKKPKKVDSTENPKKSLVEEETLKKPKKVDNTETFKKSLLEEETLKKPKKVDNIENLKKSIVEEEPLKKPKKLDNTENPKKSMLEEETLKKTKKHENSKKSILEEQPLKNHENSENPKKSILEEETLKNPKKHENSKKSILDEEPLKKLKKHENSENPKNSILEEEPLKKPKKHENSENPKKSILDEKSLKKPKKLEKRRKLKIEEETLKKPKKPENPKKPLPDEETLKQIKRPENIENPKKPHLEEEPLKKPKKPHTEKKLKKLNRIENPKTEKHKKTKKPIPEENKLKKPETSKITEETIPKKPNNIKNPKNLEILQKPTLEDTNPIPSKEPNQPENPKNPNLEPKIHSKEISKTINQRQPKIPTKASKKLFITPEIQPKIPRDPRRKLDNTVTNLTTKQVTFNLNNPKKDEIDRKRLSLHEYNKRKATPITTPEPITNPESPPISEAVLKQVEDSIDHAILAHKRTFTNSWEDEPEPAFGHARTPDRRIDINDFNIRPLDSATTPSPSSGPIGSLQSFREVVDNKLNSLNLKIPKTAKLNSVDSQKIHVMIERVLANGSEPTRDKYEVHREQSELKLQLRRKRFRNLHDDSSDEDWADSGDYSVVQRSSQGVPKLLIKRLPQPFVKLERSEAVDLLAKRRKLRP